MTASSRAGPARTGPTGARDADTFVIAGDFGDDLITGFDAGEAPLRFESDALVVERARGGVLVTEDGGAGSVLVRRARVEGVEGAIEGHGFEAFRPRPFAPRRTAR